MKHIIIGDLHGRDVWKQAPIYQNAKVVFLGDYVDSYSRSNKEILRNLDEIVAFKKAHPDRVVLLIGNHDAQYMNYPYGRCAGFRPSMQFELTSFFSQHRHHFNVAYQVRNVLMTHAGVTNAWYRKFKRDPFLQKYDVNKLPIAALLNHMGWKTKDSILYSECRYRTGEDNEGGPLWADFYATFNDALNGYDQIVGHTPVSEATTHVWRGKSVTYIDVLNRQNYFHEIHL